MKSLWVVAASVLLSLVVICPSMAHGDIQTHHASNQVSQTAPYQYPLTRRWAVFVYYGRLTKNTLGQVIAFHDNLGREALYSIELDHAFDPSNPFRRFFQPIMTTFGLGTNFTYRNDPEGGIYGVNLFVLARWANFPWNHFITTTFAIGEGLSYDSKVPPREKVDSTKTKRLLNYLMFEVTAAVPEHPQYELVFRIHHRSGAFTLYGAGNSGSTAVGLGFRYIFN